MSYEFSRCLCLQLPDPHKALEFYERVMGLEVVNRDGDSLELKADQFRLFLDKGEMMGPIMEYLVPDVEDAKAELLGAGCEVVKWEGRGGCCYMKDPFGFVFNLYEDSE